ncbi:MAG: hypothetical protein QGM45_11470, partial [Anaerolineales bacterium]|nr:hypothetical protein [Anaerolineales bacterium]
FGNRQMAFYKEMEREPRRLCVEYSLEGKIEVSEERDPGQTAMELYAPPSPGRLYVGGIDLADGDSDGRAESSISIQCRETGDFVAHWHGDGDAKKIAGVAFAMGKYFGWAPLLPETTGIGLAVARELEFMEYPELPSGKEILEYEDLPEDKQKRQRVGFDTRANTRPILLDFYRGLVRRYQVGLFSGYVVKQHKRFVVIKGKPQAMKKRDRDDCVFSNALCTIQCRWESRYWVPRNLESKDVPLKLEVKKPELNVYDEFDEAIVELDHASDWDFMVDG